MRKACFLQAFLLRKVRDSNPRYGQSRTADFESAPIDHSGNFPIVRAKVQNFFGLRARLLLFSLIKFMDDQSAAKFRLKPRCFGRHDFSTVGYVHDLLHCYGIESQCHFHLA